MSMQSKSIQLTGPLAAAAAVAVATIMEGAASTESKALDEEAATEESEWASEATCLD